MTNNEKVMSMESEEQLANFLADEIYNIFRSSLTKKKFVEETLKWLKAEHEEYGV